MAYRRFVDNGKVITTAGVSAGIDGSLHLVARLLGRAVADRTAEYDLATTRDDGRFKALVAGL